MSRTLTLVMIRGRVQGVGFRAWVEFEATARNLEGWVRNRRDGSVEALFAGPANSVSDMIVLCRRGPTLARVMSVTDEPAHPDAIKLKGAESFAMLSTL